MKNKEPEQKITDISIHIASLSASFKPTPDARHATHWFSTDEAYDAIRRIDPGAQISKEQVHQAMLDAGYKYQNRPGSSGLDFRWMLQAKN
ncbi:5-formyltetrahydrofolate cyclo-ligase [Bacteroides rodentium]